MVSFISFDEDCIFWFGIFEWKVVIRQGTSVCLVLLKTIQMFERARRFCGIESVKDLFVHEDYGLTGS